MTGCECVWLWFACGWVHVYVELCEPGEENKEEEQKQLEAE